MEIQPNAVEDTFFHYFVAKLFKYGWMKFIFGVKFGTLWYGLLTGKRSP